MTPDLRIPGKITTISNNCQTNMLLLIVGHFGYPEVVFPQSNNSLFECRLESQPHHNVLLLSESCFQQHLNSIEKEINVQPYIINYQKKQIDNMAGQEDAMAIAVREDAQGLG
jgi:hypothetical protein